MKHHIKFSIFITVLACLAVMPVFAGVCDPEGDGTVSLGEVICELQVLTGVRTDSSSLERRGSVEGYLVPEQGNADTTSPRDTGGIGVACHYGDDQVMNTVTDPNGFFRFPDLPAGPAQIRVLNEGGDPLYFQVGIEGNKTIAMNFNLQPAAVHLVGAIEGVVRGVSGNGDNMPLHEAVIRLTPVITEVAADEIGPDGENMMPPYKSATDAHGHYKIENIPAGHYMVSSSKEGFKKVLSTVTIAGDRILHQDFMLFPEHPAEYGTLFGSVAEKNTPDATIPSPFIPVPGVQVQLTPNSGQGTVGPLLAMTNEKGRFMFPKLPVGDYILIIEQPAFEPYRRPVRIDADMPGIVPVIGPPPDNTTNTNNTNDDPDGNQDADNPGMNALFNVMRQAEIGFFCIGPHGNWHMGVNFVRVVLKRNNMEEKASLEGLVFFPDGNQRKPVPDALVTIEPFFPYPTLEPVLTDDAAFAPLPVYETNTDGEGIYRFDNLPAGEYHLRVEAPDFGSVNEPFHDMIRLMPGENHRDIALTPRILCEDNSECPADGYCARGVGSCEGEGMCRKRPDACPDYYEPVCGCDGVTYGNECEAASEGMNIAYWDRCLPPGETGSLTGHVTRSDVNCLDAANCLMPVPMAHVALFPSTPNDAGSFMHPGYETMTDENGYYKFPKLWVGSDGVMEYNMFVRAEEFMPWEEIVTIRTGENVRDVSLTPPAFCHDNTQCAPDLFCEKPFGACEREGVCQPRPQACPEYYAPVCGCDEETYGNKCEAAAAGVTPAYEGECVPSGESAVLSGRITDGMVDCATGADCIIGIPGAFVEIFHLSPISSRPPFHAQAVTDENGDYKFPHIPISPDAAGDINLMEFEITVSAPGYMKRTETITLIPGENTWNAELMSFMPCVEDNECGDGQFQFCARYNNDCEGPGICSEKPEGCYLMYNPVCGCDGNTYGNDCEANMAGVSVRYKGGCEDHPF